MVGLVLCLVDVAYIMGSIDRQPRGSAVQEAQAAAALAASGRVDGGIKRAEEPAAVGAALDAATLTDEERMRLIEAKQPILDIIKDAGIGRVDDETLILLPTWKEVVDLYGEEPRIYGLENCKVFQEHSDPADHFVSTAGTFNSGTNLMAESLIANCHMQDRMDKYGYQQRGVRWQVPW